MKGENLITISDGTIELLVEAMTNIDRLPTEAYMLTAYWLGKENRGVIDETSVGLAEVYYVGVAPMVKVSKKGREASGRGVTAFTREVQLFPSWQSMVVGVNELREKYVKQQLDSEFPVALITPRYG